MHKKLYLTGIEKRPGKSFVSLGFLSLLKEQQTSLKCFKLFSESDNSQIPLIEAINEESVKHLMSISQAIDLMRDSPADLISAALEFTDRNNDAQITYFEGTDFESDHDLFEYQFNLMLAQQLNCDVILVLSAKDRTLEHSVTLLRNALEISHKSHARVTGVIVNRVPSAMETEAQELFEKNFPELTFIAVLPEFDELAHPSMRDIAIKLHAQIITGTKELHRPVRQFTIAAKTVGNFLESRLERNGMLIITPDDRIDVLLGSLLADQSANYPKIAGIVLTGGEMPGPVIREILSGLEYTFPVLLTKLRTYETATTLYTARFSLSSTDPAKVSKAIESMRPFLVKPLLKLLSDKTKSPRLTPAVFLHDISSKAKKLKQHIILPEGDDSRILIAADYVLKRQIVNLTILGKPEKILLQAKRLGLDLPDVNIIDLETTPLRETYAQKYYELRKHKNINLPIALERMADVNYFAAMMVYCGDADGMVSGAAHTTADTVRPALEIIKTKPDVNKVSSVFIMCMPTRVLIYGDCAINPEPDSQTLAEIAIQAAQIAKNLGIKPKVALLSYSSGHSGKGESVEKVAKALDIVKQLKPQLVVEGPIQYDAAVDPEVARKKLPNSKLLGDANVLIFPDLNTGNNTYKAVQRETGALAIGPVLLGLNKPVNDLSRGCTPEDIINTILVTAIQAKGDK
ncbi:phosphate acetyltransferase [Legionella jordanis]|uniref:Phosphate acetyltransferase n=1 Tax=Legionella jordanis TaxID=456 RepID=A0A0W0VAR0_9GAMM|nr:phosphate acetyltransferase [Legionella jordanis]KTD17192.1 phosphate acetyl/butaryl transferase [Legionella jordanis]RMX03312.1 phosphate acetyltransferase [Legionella jordanis]RMX18290.1 phosphate acetyltransferase [Legionella jordanis]VEH12610.1 phosphate acetyl/butaryl transferase [Legionella jordanis]HAT8713316.1 phosphate acetyltransferase [Legionella jordanis]